MEVEESYARTSCRIGCIFLMLSLVCLSFVVAAVTWKIVNHLIN